MQSRGWTKFTTTVARLARPSTSVLISRGHDSVIVDLLGDCKRSLFSSVALLVFNTGPGTEVHN